MQIRASHVQSSPHIWIWEMGAIMSHPCFSSLTHFLYMREDSDNLQSAKNHLLRCSFGFFIPIFVTVYSLLKMIESKKHMHQAFFNTRILSENNFFFTPDMQLYLAREFHVYAPCWKFTVIILCYRFLLIWTAFLSIRCQGFLGGGGHFRGFKEWLLGSGFSCSFLGVKQFLPMIPLTLPCFFSILMLLCLPMRAHFYTHMRPTKSS